MSPKLMPKAKPAMTWRSTHRDPVVVRMEHVSVAEWDALSLRVHMSSGMSLLLGRDDAKSFLKAWDAWVKAWSVS